MNERTINPTLTAAQTDGAGGKKSTTRNLLEALSKHEGDSDLGLLAYSLLFAGDYFKMDKDDLEAVENHAAKIKELAESIAEECQRDADYYLQDWIES